MLVCNALDLGESIFLSNRWLFFTLILLRLCMAPSRLASRSAMAGEGTKCLFLHLCSSGGQLWFCSGSSLFSGSVISMALDGLAFRCSAWNTAIPHLVYLEDAYLFLKRQLQYRAFPVAPSPTPRTPRWNCFLICVFLMYCITLLIFVLSSSSMRRYS